MALQRNIVRYFVCSLNFIWSNDVIVEKNNSVDGDHYNVSTLVVFDE